jgi:hypothetical protein
MNWIENNIFILAGLVACIWVTTVALKNIGQFGNANDIKKESLFRILTNFYGVIVLLLLIGARSMDIINETYFYSLFTAIVVGLGFKMTNDYLTK